MTAAAEQLLLQALGGGADGSVTAESLLSELAGDDPALALMTKLVLEGGASEIDPPPPTDTDLGELEELRERNEALAAALGACFACWGTDIFCTHCGGEGRPGAAAPEPPRGSRGRCSRPRPRRGGSFPGPRAFRSPSR